MQVLSGLVPDAKGGFIVSWVDARSAPPGDPHPEDYADIYAQRVTASGTVATGWLENGVPLCTAPYTQWDHEMVSDGAGGAIVAWVDYRDQFVRASDLYGQRVLASGQVAPGWPADGVALSRGLGFELGPTMVADGAGGALVAYETIGGPGGEYDLHAQHVTSSGAIAPGWDPDGVSLCKFLHEENPAAVSDGMGGMIVAWDDQRSLAGSDIYAQHVTSDFPTPALLSLVSAEAEPARVVLTWFAGSTAPTAARVYRRTTSSAWAPLGTPRDAGSGLLVFEDRTVAEGRYAYRLGYTGDAGEVFTPEVWVSVPGGHVLALAGFSPNPAPGEPVVSFSLASSQRATLNVFDVTGRAVLAREVGSLGPGSHRLALGREVLLEAGVYWLRLTQAGRSLTAKGLVVR